VRPDVDEEKQDEHHGRSQRDWLQKAEKELTEVHRSIVEERRAKGDITSWVDLTCRYGETQARTVASATYAPSGEMSFKYSARSQFGQTGSWTFQLRSLFGQGDRSFETELFRATLFAEGRQCVLGEERVEKTLDFFDRRGSANCCTRFSGSFLKQF